MLSDIDITFALGNGSLRIDPLSMRSDTIQSNSIDLTLDRKFATINESRFTDITVSNSGAKVCTPRILNPFDLPDDLYVEHWLPPIESKLGSTFVLNPGCFALANTRESVSLDETLCARIEGKSSLARLGLAVHITAGFVDSGWSGQLTLELYNFSPLPLALTPGMKIAQLSVAELKSPANRPYGHPDLKSKYQDSVGPVGSQYDINEPPQ